MLFFCFFAYKTQILCVFGKFLDEVSSYKFVTFVQLFALKVTLNCCLGIFITEMNNILPMDIVANTLADQLADLFVYLLWKFLYTLLFWWESDYLKMLEIFLSVCFG